MENRVELDRENILHEVMDKSKWYWSVKFVHASGHGWQHKDHGNSKAQLKFDINKFFEDFDLDDSMRDDFVVVFGKKHIHHDDSVLILENQEQRSAKKNEENVLKHLKDKLSEFLEEEKERIETQVPQHEKEQRLEDKKHHSKKKEYRKSPDIS